MREHVSDVAFTSAVKAEQSRRGSRALYQRVENGGGWRNRIDERLEAFIEVRDSFYLGTSNAEGQPYIQHRGGSRGFLRILDERTLGFADHGGNQQYITLGNLAENDKAFIFLMDYANRQRMKLWGRARVVEDDPALLERVADPALPDQPDRAILFTIEAWDINCPKFIPQRFSESEIAPLIDALHQKIENLEAELAALRGGGEG